MIYGGSFGGSKALLKNRLQLATSNAISVTRQVENALVINATVTAAYNLNPHHRFTARWMLLNNRPDPPFPSSRFTEHTSELAYTWSF
ncbi:MAG: hypothetical protein EOP50_15230 [Sphingobacteriales bacterium]|nr:MAG: hypothetical protein EOP50_15230 [Sphingobacteriales bacterium]